MSAALESTKPSYASTSFASFSVADIEATKPQLKLPARIAIAPPLQAYPFLDQARQLAVH
jgi:hypothetical protein